MSIDQLFERPKADSTNASITIRRPDDWHVHLRDGAMLRGVRRRPDHAITHSIVMRSHSGTVRFIEAHHNFAQKTWTPT